MKNDYEIRGDIAAVFVNKRDGSKVEFYISTDKLDLVKMFPNTWCENGNGYISGFYPNNRTEGRKEWILHIYIVNAPDGKLVDHKDGNRKNNTDNNLRVTDKSGNAQNVNARATNKSGILGVSYYKNNEKWGAHLQVNGTKHYLGLYETPELAGEAVREARAKLMPYSKEALEGVVGV
jgi:hypothetical protein